MLPAIIGLAAVMLVDSPAVFSKSAGFVFDDLAVIVYNQDLQSGGILQALAWNPFRSAVYFTFWVQLQLGGLDAQQFRFANVILHWLAGVLIMAVAGMIFPGRKNLPWLAAFLFWLNPVFIEAENQALGRTEIMVTVFSLAAVMFYLDKRRPMFSRAGFLVSLALALLCKEVAATIPAVVLLLSRFRGEKPKRVELAGGFALVAVYGALRLLWPIQLAKTPELTPSWSGYFLDQNWIFWFASLKTLIPFHLTFDYQPQPSPALGAAFLALNLGVLGVITWKSVRGWKTGWLLLTYPLLYLPLAIIPLADALRESRLYLTGGWLLILFSAAVRPALERKKILSRLLIAAAILCLISLAITRARLWSSEDRLWRDAMQKSPGKFRPVYNYASCLRRELKLEEAKKIYFWAKTLEPDNPKVDWALNLIEEAGKRPELIEQLRRQL